MRQYTFSQPGWDPASAHFTQLVWKGTTGVGCAVATNCTWPVFACRYSPASDPAAPAATWAKQVLPSTPGLPSAPSHAAAAAALAPAAAPPPSPALALAAAAHESAAELQVLALQRTNAYRVMHQAQPLEWDGDLEASAAAAADYCGGGTASSSSLSPSSSYGENVARGDLPDILAAIDRWYSEVRASFPPLPSPLCYGLQWEAVNCHAP